MKEKTLSDKQGYDDNLNRIYFEEDVIRAIKRFQENVINNASEKRQIIEVGKVLNLLKIEFGEDLT